MQKLTQLSFIIPADNVCVCVCVNYTIKALLMLRHGKTRGPGNTEGWPPGSRGQIARGEAITAGHTRLVLPRQTNIAIDNIPRAGSNMANNKKTIHLKDYRTHTQGQLISAPLKLSSYSLPLLLLFSFVFLCTGTYKYLLITRHLAKCIRGN